jgi:hypothetical protein
MTQDKVNLAAPIASDGQGSMPSQAAPDLHDAIIRLPCKMPPLAQSVEVWAYQYGHRDARHAAAELASEHTAALIAENARLRVAGVEAAAMADPTDDEIAAWADGFIRESAYNRAVAVQIATEAAKWVRGQRVQVGWYYESPATGGSGVRQRMSDSELAEWRRIAHVWPVYRAEREAVPGIADVHTSDGAPQ